MLEEVSMDKKTGNRSVQAPIKGNPTESKKTQDAQPNGKQPRGCRRREPVGSNGFKFEQNRKPAPQKNKAMDKRPRPRGGNFGCGKENSQISYDQLDGEYGSLFSGGRKKHNLNHLLNFHYEPRGDASAASRQPHYRQYNSYGLTSQSSNSLKALMATQTHKYNKEQFLQANCQFVVRFGVDYTPYMVDPDLLVNWDYVELIRVWSNENVTCPICLYPPVAGKITRCGHIFCWSCILHYLALSDKTWRKCPICYESVHKNDLKSVESISCSTSHVGQEITLQLMKREKGTLIATPVAQYEPRTAKHLLYISEKTLDTVYSKLLLAQYEDVVNIIEREHKELNEQITDSAGCPELCFVEQAVEILLQRKIQLEANKEVYLKSKHISNTTEVNSLKNPEKVASGDINKQENITPIDNTSLFNLSHGEMQAESVDRTRHDSLNSEGDDVNNVRAEDLYIGTNQNQINNQPVKYFYFYQAVDGQQVYLHAVNVRMLEMNYGSLDHCPTNITGVILEKESGSMTAELRRRLRYMQHVPITCQFEVVEISLCVPTISEETLHSFYEQLELRKRRRAEQAREERKREKRIEESERRMFGRTPIPNLRIESLDHFPQCGTVDFPPTPSFQLPVDEESYISSPSSSTSLSMSSMAALSIKAETSGSPSENAGPSFAQMLREDKTCVSRGGWPSVGKGCGKTSTVWGQTQKHDITMKNNELEPDTLSHPTLASFNIAEALENAAMAQRNGADGTSGKKKKKKKVLFSTGMACTGK